MTVKRDARGEDGLDAEPFCFDRVHPDSGIVSRDHANVLMYQSQRVTPKCPLGLQVAHHCMCDNCRIVRQSLARPSLLPPPFWVISMLVLHIREMGGHDDLS
jgi:hypothetical protein